MKRREEKGRRLGYGGLKELRVMCEVGMEGGGMYMEYEEG